MTGHQVDSAATPATPPTPGRRPRAVRSQTRRIEDLSAAVLGTGFIGIVHVEALRRLGVTVRGVCAQTPEIARRKADTYPLPHVYASVDDLLADPEVDVVHVATPNQLHYAQVKAALAAGKHVVCEKPLAVTAAESRELVELAERSGLVHCTNFNVRFYPQVQEARARIRRGDIGTPLNVHGSYLQDWLLHPSDWNWRLDPAIGGELRAVADIGSHWLDLAQFLTGRRIEAVLADLVTVIPVRQRPTGPVETFTAASGSTEPVEITSDDVAHVILGLEGGVRGSVTISQVSAGHRNQISVEVAGSEGAIAWNSDLGEQLWLGHRDRPNEVLVRDPALMVGPVPGSLPGGHAEGFHDASKELYRAVYRAVAAGEPGDGYPTFHDGHWENVIAEAVLRSSRERRWVELTR